MPTLRTIHGAKFKITHEEVACLLTFVAWWRASFPNVKRQSADELLDAMRELLSRADKEPWT
jgi:hypothetical protein